MYLQIKSFKRHVHSRPLEGFALISYSLHFCEHAAMDAGAWRGMFWGLQALDLATARLTQDVTTRRLHTPSYSVM